MSQSRLPRHVKRTVPQSSSRVLFNNPEPFSTQTESITVRPDGPMAKFSQVANVSPRTPMTNVPRGGPKIFQTSPSTNLTGSPPRPSALRGRNVSAPPRSNSLESKKKAGPSESSVVSPRGQIGQPVLPVLPTERTNASASPPARQEASKQDTVVSEHPVPRTTRSRSFAGVSRLVSKIVRSDPLRASDPGPRVAQARVADHLLLIDDTHLHILRRLGRLVGEMPGYEGKGAETVRSLIRGDKLIALHSSEKEAKRQAERDRKKGEKRFRKEHPVFGKSLISVVHYAALPLFLGNQLECRLPTVLIKTVEEIYARGFHIAPMFRNLPEEQTEGVRNLIDFHSTGPRYGDDEHSPIHTAPLPDIAATLLHYLNTLPDPPLDSALLHAILRLCVLPSTCDLKKYGRPCSPWKERRRIRVAKLVLRLLPKSHFSTLVYLLALLSLVPTDPVHDLTYKDIADVFGYAICGPRDSLSFLRDGDMTQRIKTRDTDRFEEVADGYVRALAKEALLWLLLYWDYISEGLLTDDFEGDLENFGEEDEAVYGKDAWDDQDDAEGDEGEDDGVDDSWLNPLVELTAVSPCKYSPRQVSSTSSFSSSPNPSQTSLSMKSSDSDASYEMPFRLFQNAKPTPGTEYLGHSGYFSCNPRSGSDQLCTSLRITDAATSSTSIATSAIAENSTFEKSPTITGASALEELIHHQENDIQFKMQTISSQANRISTLENEAKKLREERDQSRAQLEKLKAKLERLMAD
ncbi:uncharacterized protein EI90DRAFT_3036523 [Cantharellus anzutake]|uniref:uncharacterized protein n=1 Tax=Cantharellus anzutake TaxID=1750568 RepID=UPI0019044677|nr:uncharacterized protein EI90DRAFT_3036523 [Cantharellus anzutake]KAF8340699.1 hypothetical protein EI90DRAFT_3036523 [Cantharellus anzutake]